MKRRSLFLAGVAALAPAVAVAAVPQIPAAPHPDAALMWLGEQLAAAMRAEAKAWADLEASAERGDDSPFAVEARHRQSATGEVVDRIAWATATTHAGLVVKLQAVMWCQGGPGAWDRHGCTDEQIMATLMDDLAAMNATAEGRAAA